MAKGKKAKGGDGAAKTASAKTASAKPRQARPARARQRRNDKALSSKDYEKQLKKLHVELVKLQEWVVPQGAQGLHRVRGPRRRRQGRHDQGDHRAREPARVPRDRAAGADRAREVADVHPALPAAPPGGGRDRDLRPQLVQPRGRRARDGLLHRRAGRTSSSQVVPLVEKAMVDSGIILHQVLARGEPGGADAAAQGAHRRRPQDLEALADGPEVVQPLVRLLARARRHVRRDRHRVGAVVRRATPRTRSACGSTSSRTCSRRIPYKEAPREKVKLPDRQKAHGYVDPDYPYKFVAEKF